MKRRESMEFMVGLFVIFSFACIAYMTVRLGKVEFFNKGDYTLKARFLNIQGLKKGANVEIAGIRVGKVLRSYLDVEDQMAVVVMQIDKGIEIGDDVIASIKTSGFIGDKYMLLSLGGSTDNLKDGDMITETESALDLESLVSKFAFGRVES